MNGPEMSKNTVAAFVFLGMIYVLTHPEGRRH